MMEELLFVFLCLHHAFRHGARPFHHFHVLVASHLIYIWQVDEGKEGNEHLARNTLVLPYRRYLAQQWIEGLSIWIVCQQKAILPSCLSADGSYLTSRIDLGICPIGI